MIVDKNAKGPFRVEKKGMMFAICDTYGVNCVEVEKYRPMLFDTEEQATDVGQYLGLIPKKVLSTYASPSYHTQRNWSIPAPPQQPQTVTGRIASGGIAGQQKSVSGSPVYDPSLNQGATPATPKQDPYFYDIATDAFYDRNTGQRVPYGDVVKSKQGDVVMAGDSRFVPFYWGSIFDDDEEFF